MSTDRMSTEEISARISVRRERDRDGYHWAIEIQGEATDAQAAAITFRADAAAVVLGEFVKVVDARGVRIGHVSSATYHEQPFGPAYVRVGIELR